MWCCTIFARPPFLFGGGSGSRLAWDNIDKLLLGLTLLINFATMQCPSVDVQCVDNCPTTLLSTQKTFPQVGYRFLNLTLQMACSMRHIILDESMQPYPCSQPLPFVVLWFVFGMKWKSRKKKRGNNGNTYCMTWM